VRHFDVVVAYDESKEYLRGRNPGDIPRLLVEGLRKAGLAAENAIPSPDEFSALRTVLDMARPGDLVFFKTVHPEETRKILANHPPRAEPTVPASTAP
jgi:cell wall-associated NlpC family hydrolase